MIKNEQIFFLCLINLILQIEKFISIAACDKLTSLDTVRAGKPEIPDLNTASYLRNCRLTAVLTRLANV